MSDTSKKLALGALASIPVLESSRQWIQWKRDIEDFLNMHGYGDLLEIGPNEEPIPDETDKERFLRTRAWAKDEKTACAYINNRLGPNARNTVKDVAENVHDRLEYHEACCHIR